MNVGMLVSNEVVRDTRVLQEARTLAAAGHRVRIVGWDRFDRGARDGPVADGVDVALVRTRGMLRAAPGPVLRNPLWWRRARRLALERPADVWWAHDLDTLPAAVWLKERTGKPLVYDAHEIFGAMIADDHSGAVVNAAYRLEARLLPSVDHVVTVNDGLATFYGKFGKPVTVVMNCREAVAERYEPPTEPVCTVLYVGTFHRSRFVFEIVQAVQETDGVRLKIGGHKALSAKVAEACAASPRTEFLGPVPQDRVMALTRACHVVCALLDPANLNNVQGTPNKLFEAMAAGRPVLATADTLSGSIVAQSGCGLAIPYDVRAAKEALARLRDDPGLQRRLGEGGLRAARERYNWAAQAGRLRAVLDGL